MKKIIGGLIIFFTALGFALTAPYASAKTLMKDIASNNTYNWAGYIAQKGNYTAVSGTWNISAVVKNNNLAQNLEWVGIGGANSNINTLIQVGTETQINTNGADVRHYAFYELIPSDEIMIPISINTGDSITAGISQQSSGQWLISFKDNTTNNSYQKKVSYATNIGTAEWIVEAPAFYTYMSMAISNFSTVNFSNCSAVNNGQQVNLSQANAGSINLVNLIGQVLAQPSVINSDGASFSVTRNSNNSSIFL